MIFHNNRWFFNRFRCQIGRSTSYRATRLGPWKPKDVLQLELQRRQRGGQGVGGSVRCHLHLLDLRNVLSTYHNQHECYSGHNEIR